MFKFEKSQWLVHKLRYVKIYLRFLYKHYWLILVLLLIAFVYTFAYFKTYLSINHVGGWDGDAHYAVNKYFSDYIFPHVVGWISSNNSGFPWPVGYTPLLTYLLAIWSRILPFSFLIDFKLFFVVLTLIFPLLAYFVLWQLNKNKLIAFLGGLLTVHFLVIPVSIVYFGGITMRAIYAMGHYPQFLATIFIMLWLATVFKPGRKWTVLSAILAALVLLANLHTFEVCMVILAVKWIFQLFSKHKTKELIQEIIINIGVVLGLTVFWLVPLLQNASYLLTRTTGEVNASSAIKSWGIIGVVGFFLIFHDLVRNKDRSYKAILWFSAICIFLLSILPIRNIWPGLPLQPDRLFPYSYLLIILLIPISLFSLLKNWKPNIRLGIFVVITLALFTTMRPAQLVVDGNFHIDQSEEDLIQYVKTLPGGRSLVEAWFDPIPNVQDEAFFIGQPTHMVISGQIADTDSHETIWGVFRESAINSPFIMPIRNEFSPDFNEAYGVVCWLCNNEPGLDANYINDFYNQPLDTSLKRARLYGVKYFVMRSDSMKKQMRIHPDLTLLKVFGNWDVFELKNPPQLAETLVNPPVLTFTTLKNRDRAFDSYDWLRLNEEWINYANFDHYFALAKDQDLSTTQDLEAFKLTMIVEYKYSDIDKALQRLTSYAHNNQLFIWQSDDPLFKLLKSANLSNIHVINRTGNVHNDFQGVLNSLQPFTSKNLPQLLTVKKVVSSGEVTLTMPNSTQPIYLKYSYFPWWKTNRQIYMASPAQMLLPCTENCQDDLQVKI